MTKVEAIEALLKAKGGAASLEYIYNHLETYYLKTKNATDWKAGIRGVIYREIYANKTFKRIDVGIYALRDSQDESIEGELAVHVDKPELLIAARQFTSTKPSHRVTMGEHKVRIENRSQKERIALLEDYSCQICEWTAEWIDKKTGKTRRQIDIDHIQPKEDKGGEESANLWALCPNHHREKTLGIITIDVQKKEVRRHGELIELHHDSHLFL